jgi:hypothetical protein
VFARRSSVSWRPVGAIAQLAERFHGMEEVKGSIPFSSTKKPQVTGLGFSGFRSQLGRVSNGVSNGNGQKLGSQLGVGSFLMKCGEGGRPVSTGNASAGRHTVPLRGHSLPRLRRRVSPLTVGRQVAREDDAVPVEGSGRFPLEDNRGEPVVGTCADQFDIGDAAEVG